MSLMKFSVSLRVGQAEEHLIFWDFAAPRTHLLPGKVHAVQQDLDAEKGKWQMVCAICIRWAGCTAISSPKTVGTFVV